MSEEVGQASRSSRYIEAQEGRLTFGEALDFTHYKTKRVGL
jgi:hypothetical protein